MDIEKALLKPKHLQKEVAEQIARSVSGTKKDFTDLLSLIASDNVALCKRAAWCFSLAAKLKPDWTDECQEQLVALLSKNNPQDALLRNTLRILRDCQLHRDLYDQLAYYCFEFVQDPAMPIAIRAFAMHILGQIGQALPEIRPEVKAIIEFHFEQGAAGLKSSGKSVLKAWANSDKASGKASR